MLTIVGTVLVKSTARDLLHSKRMRSYSEMLGQAVEFVRETAPASGVLVLGATRAAAEEVIRRACTAALVGVRAQGLRDLAIELAAPEMNRRGLVPVGRFVREALAARITAEAMRHQVLQYFGKVAGFPGFPRALTQALEQLRLDAAVPDGDLAWLLAAYERELAERRFADHAMRVQLAIESSLPRIAVVALDLAPRTALERRLFDAVMRHATSALDLRLGGRAPHCATALESLQQYLFSPDAVPSRADDGSVDIFSTSGEALECVEIARRIAAATVPFDEIAVLMRSADRYQPLLAEACRRAAIPVFFSRGARRPHVSGRAFLALLHCAEERLSASRFAEYLSLGQAPEDEDPPTPALWERLIVDASVIGGADRWETRLAGLREEFSRRYREERDEDSREHLERRLQALESLTRFALPMVRQLAALPGRALWGEWITVLVELAESTLRDPDRVVELIQELEPMAEIGPVTLAEVMLVLVPRLDTLPSGEEESRYGKVWAGSIEEARGLSFRHVFVPGLNEGLFPRPPAEGALVHHTNDDSELLRVAVACASEKIGLSFSRLDLLTGRERVPSFYAFAAHRAAGGTDLDVRQFEERARSKTFARIGWPAPQRPEDAIDDAEFDLATLAPLAEGSGRYLQSLPGRAVHALRARWTRWHAKSWKAADGLVVEEISSEVMKPYSLSARPWSPSALQQYARCPYRFALRGIFGLREAERPAGIQRLDPATRGEIFHRVQYELLCDLNERELLPINSVNLGWTLARLDAVLDTVAEHAAADLVPAIPAIWRAEIQSIRADLRGLLQQKAAAEPDWKPEFFELSFGLRDPIGRDPRSRREPVELEDGTRLQGSIDLVERHTSGIVRVVDHKTGRIPQPKPETLGGGEVLQPALYALAAERLLGEPVAFGRLSYATIAQNYAAIDVPLNPWMRQRTAQALRVIGSAIETGFLPAAPRKDGCRHCEYLVVCGPYEEERVHEKSHEDLRPLTELRAIR